MVCLTNDANAVRDRIGTQFAIAGHTPEYRAMLDREGAIGPQDVAIVGNERTVARHVEQLREAGVTEFMAAPYGSGEEQLRTADLLISLAT